MRKYRKVLEKYEKRRKKTIHNQGCEKSDMKKKIHEFVGFEPKTDGSYEAFDKMLDELCKGNK